MNRIRRSLSLAILLFSALATAAQDKPIRVQLVKKADGWQLLRGGKPYFVKGAGGTHSPPELAAMGGNSIRTWGAEQLPQTLADARRNGLTVAAGIWLRHSDGDMDYHDAAAVKAQFETARGVIEKYKNDPSVLVWGIGNEMEGYKGETDTAVWNAVEQIAKLSHQIDPNHPTMTVIAEVGSHKVEHIHELCPDIDIIGVNTYGGATSMADRYRKQGGTKPYLVTEFGPLGQWEVGKTAWGAPLEPTSTAKARHYEESYKAAVLGQPGLCLGSYAFLWGNKQEATATWFGMFLADGRRVAAADLMQEFWSGKPPSNPSPTIDRITLEGPPTVAPGADLAVRMTAGSSSGDPLTVRWQVEAEQSARGSGGSNEPKPPTFSDAVTEGDPSHAKIKAPSVAGAYRICVWVYDRHNGAATANIPFRVALPGANRL